MYNEDDSPIVRDVTSIVTRLTLFIKNPGYKNINVDVSREMITAELEYRSKSKKKKRRLRFVIYRSLTEHKHLQSNVGSSIELHLTFTAN